MIGYSKSFNHKFKEIDGPVWYVFERKKGRCTILASNSPNVVVGENLPTRFFNLIARDPEEILILIPDKYKTKFIKQIIKENFAEFI